MNEVIQAAAELQVIWDWVDVERTIVRQTGRLDWGYIHEQLAPLAELKDAPEILDQLERRRAEFEQ